MVMAVKDELFLFQKTLRMDSFPQRSSKKECVLTVYRKQSYLSLPDIFCLHFQIENVLFTVNLSSLCSTGNTHDAMRPSSGR